jgi:hypothetical protein
MPTASMTSSDEAALPVVLGAGYPMVIHLTIKLQACPPDVTSHNNTCLLALPEFLLDSKLAKLRAGR